MPNHVTTICTVTGPAAAVAGFATERTASLDVLCLPVVAAWPYDEAAHEADLKRRAWEPAGRSGGKADG